MEFDWHDAKAAANLKAHDVTFELAKTVFKDPFAIERLDDRENYGENRYLLIGMDAERELLLVVYTERKEHIRIILARRATPREQNDYYKKNG